MGKENDKIGKRKRIGLFTLLFMSLKYFNKQFEEDLTKRLDNIYCRTSSRSKILAGKAQKGKRRTSSSAWCAISI